jgi:hypothetical protein
VNPETAMTLIGQPIERVDNGKPIDYDVLNGGEP